MSTTQDAINKLMAGTIGEHEKRIAELERRMEIIYAQHEGHSHKLGIAETSGPTDVAAPSVPTWALALKHTKPQPESSRGAEGKDCPVCGKSILWGSLGPREYHDCKPIIVSDKPNTPAAEAQGKEVDGPEDMRRIARCLSYITTKAEGSAKHLLFAGAMRIDSQAKRIADLEKERDDLRRQLDEAQLAWGSDRNRCEDQKDALRREVEELRGKMRAGEGL